MYSESDALSIVPRYPLLQKIWSHLCYYSLLDMSSCTNSLCLEYILCLECLIEVRNKKAVLLKIIQYMYFLNNGRHNTASYVTQYLSTELHVTVTRLSHSLPDDVCTNLIYPPCNNVSVIHDLRYSSLDSHSKVVKFGINSVIHD